MAHSTHFLHPFSDNAALAASGTRLIERTEGVFIFDHLGNQILDGMSGLWCVQMGYSQQALKDAARQQMEQMPFYHNFFQTSVPTAVQLAELLPQVMPEGFERFFFTNSGSEAIDTMVRVVRHYWSLKHQPEKKYIIGRNNGYHGSTIAGMSIGGMAEMQQQGKTLLPNVAHIDQPYHFEYQADNETEAQFAARAAQWLEDKILALGAENVAAFIGEPVQGAGGVIIPPKEYWAAIARICRKHNILLVSDEVICGFGRLGQWFGCQHYGVMPDIMTFAKGITSGYAPLGGVALNQEVGTTIYNGGEFIHGFTYSGHPVSCAVALANVKQMIETNIVSTVHNTTAPYFKERFASLNNHPLVYGAETCGMLGGLLLVADKEHKKTFDSSHNIGFICRQHCFESGVVMRSVGDRMVLAPPLVISHQEIDMMIKRITLALDKTYQHIQHTKV